MKRFLLSLLTCSLVSAAHAQAPFKLILTASEHKIQKGKVTKKELLELQRKMLNHLMELYGD